MATRPNLVQHLEDAIGIDYVSSDLTRPPNSFKSLKNFQRGKGRSLRGRVGCQNFPPGGFLGFHNYSYQNLTSGGTVQEMIAINDHLWKLKSANLSITGGTNLNHRVQLNSATATYRFTISNGSTPYTLSGNPYLDLITGMESNPTTVEALRASIDANASLACARPASLKFAQVNGTQGPVSTITVFAGHNLAAGDYIQFRDHAEDKLTWRIITATTATTITFSSSWGNVSVVGNQIMGPLAASAASIPVNDAYATTSSTLELPFYYWEPILHVTDKYAPFRSFWASRNSSSWKQPCFVNADNKLYILTESPGQTLRGHDSYPHYYDGLKVARAGLPKIESGLSLASTGGGALAAGTYKYRARFAKRDNNGITYYGQPDDLNVSIVHPGGSSIDVTFPMPKFCANASATQAVVNGNQIGVTTIAVQPGHFINVGDTVIFRDHSASSLFREDVVSAVDKNLNTITISGGTVEVDDLDVIYSKYPAGFDDRSLLGWGGPSSNVLTSPIITLSSSPVRVGETVLFNDLYATPVVTPKNLQARTLTAVSPTSITWGGTTVNLDVTTNFATSIWVEIYRTKSGGNKFYLIARVPVGAQADFLSFDDATADADLGLDGELDEPEIGFELDLPPRAAIACLHQGSMVYSRIQGEPNTVAHSDISGGLEAVPLASNYFDVPSNVEGSIAAVASDNDSRLAVFKPRAYYDYSGDMPGGAFQGRAVTEGDYGISSQASICKINGMVVGIGPLGPVGVRNGERVENFAINIRPAFKDNPNINVDRAVGVNDNTTEQLLFWIPPSTAGSGQQLMFMHDYGLDRQWFNWSFSDGYDPGGGFVVFEGNLYHLSLYTVNGISGRIFRRHELFVNVDQRYADNHTIIPYQIRTQPHHDDTPSLKKTFKDLKLFSMYSQFDSADFTICQWSIKTYRNFQESTAHTETTKTFSSSSEFENTVSLRSGNATALQLLLENTTILQCPHLTGYELILAESYVQETVKKR